MRQVTLNVYKYSELSEKAKEAARAWFREVSVGDEWWDITYEDAKHVKLEITSSDTYRGTITGKFTHGAEETAWAIEKEHGETCATYKTAKAFLAERDEIVNNAPKDENGEFEDERELDQKLDACEKEFLRALLEDYLVLLRQEYDYLTSDEHVAETIEINEYEFYENGKRA